VSLYARLRPLLTMAAAGERLTPAHAELLDLAGGAATSADRDAAGGDGPTRTGTPTDDPALRQTGDELGTATAAVRALAAGDTEPALAVLERVLDAPLLPSPLESLLEEVGALLARNADAPALAHRFLERRRAYRQRFGEGAALYGLVGLLSEPERFAQLDLATRTGDDEPAAASPPEAHDRGVPVRGFVPFSDDGEAAASAYVVTLRHLEDATTASFAVHRVVWHDLESEDPSISDLVLAFERDARSMLRTIDPETLRLRLFFGDGPAYDEVASSDGSLFDVEVNPLEGRIYLKLVRPTAWRATELPPAELWRHLTSCVLITEGQ
jgi:hypothetical protein